MLLDRQGKRNNLYLISNEDDRRLRLQSKDEKVLLGDHTCATPCITNFIQSRHNE
jgi:hypothetical protein